MICAKTNNYNIRNYTPEDKDKVFAFISDVWPEEKAERIILTWDWLFSQNPFIPDGNHAVLVEECQSKIVGLCCNIFFDLKCLDKIIRIRWGFNYSIHPMHRGEGINLFSYFLRYLKFPCFGFSNGKVALLMERLCGKDGGRIAPIYRRALILDMGRIAVAKLKNRPLSLLLGVFWSILLNRLLLQRFSLPRNNIQIERVDYFDERVDNLWDKLNSESKVLAVRNRKYLNWRFINTPLDYKVFVAKNENELLGYIVFREDSQNALPYGIIVDLFTGLNDKKTIEALLVQALRYFYNKKVVFVEYRGLLNKNTSLLQKLLKRNGFFFKKRQGYFLGFSEDSLLLSEILKSEDWFATANEPDIDL